MDNLFLNLFTAFFGEYSIISFIVIAVIAFALSGFFVVKQQNCSVVERFGRFLRIAQPGLNWRIPLVDRIQGTINLRITQLDVMVETKTKDDVFVRIMVSVQYRALEERIYDAFYKLQNHDQQIEAFVFDVVRAEIPLLILDNVFSKKDEIANVVKRELSDTMSEFGYELIKALITDIEPDSNVKSAMNEINAAQRLRLAAQERGEAEKILKVKQAEAEYESNILHGKGISGQRKAIIEGLGDTMGNFSKTFPGMQPVEVMNSVLLIQYIDALKEISSASQSSVIFVPNNPGAVPDLTDQIRNTLLAVHELDKNKKK